MTTLTDPISNSCDGTSATRTPWVDTPPTARAVPTSRARTIHPSGRNRVSAGSYASAARAARGASAAPWASTHVPGAPSQQFRRRLAGEDQRPSRIPSNGLGQEPEGPTPSAGRRQRPQQARAFDRMPAPQRDPDWCARIEPERRRQGLRQDRNMFLAHAQMIAPTRIERTRTPMHAVTIDGMLQLQDPHPPAPRAQHPFPIGRETEGSIERPDPRQHFPAEQHAVDRQRPARDQVERERPGSPGLDPVLTALPASRVAPPELGRPPD